MKGSFGGIYTNFKIDEYRDLKDSNHIPEISQHQFYGILIGHTFRNKKGWTLEPVFGKAQGWTKTSDNYSNAITTITTSKIMIQLNMGYSF